MGAQSSGWRGETKPGTPMSVCIGDPDGRRGGRTSGHEKYRRGRKYRRWFVSVHGCITGFVQITLAVKTGVSELPSAAMAQMCRVKSPPVDCFV